MNLNNFPAHIIRDVRNFQRDNRSAEQGDELSFENILDYYLMWNGIMGYTGRIVEIIESAKEATAFEINERLFVAEVRHDDEEAPGYNYVLLSGESAEDASTLLKGWGLEAATVKDAYEVLNDRFDGLAIIQTI